METILELDEHKVLNCLKEGNRDTLSAEHAQDSEVSTMSACLGELGDIEFCMHNVCHCLH